jgi:hypothetical protein
LSPQQFIALKHPCVVRHSNGVESTIRGDTAIPATAVAADEDYGATKARFVGCLEIVDWEIRSASE